MLKIHKAIAIVFKDNTLQSLVFNNCSCNANEHFYLIYEYENVMSKKVLLRTHQIKLDQILRTVITP